MLKKLILNNLCFLLQTIIGVIILKKNRKQTKSNETQKTAVNNQWTNNNTKYYPDNRERQDGPGGKLETLLI